MDKKQQKQKIYNLKAPYHKPEDFEDLSEWEDLTNDLASIYEVANKED